MIIIRDKSRDIHWKGSIIKKADGKRRKAQYYLKKATYYTRKGDAYRAKDYNRLAHRAMDNYKTQMRYAKNADEITSDYLRKAANVLRR